MNDKLAEYIIETLWSAGNGPAADTVYAVLDSARDPELSSLIQSADRFKACLFAGNISEAMQTAAPYVLKLSSQSQLTRTLLDKGWGKSWGIFVSAARPAGIEDVRKQLRQFLLVKGPEGKRLFFRFYDPRVMRVYLPTCNEDECKTLFDPVVRYFMEDATGEKVLSYDKQEILNLQKEHTFA